MPSYASDSLLPKPIWVLFTPANKLPLVGSLRIEAFVCVVVTSFEPILLNRCFFLLGDDFFFSAFVVFMPDNGCSRGVSFS